MTEFGACFENRQFHGKWSDEDLRRAAYYINSLETLTVEYALINFQEVFVANPCCSDLTMQQLLII